ncbi:MAG TPA: CueP family metal-binding protein [Bacillota bacterium]|nr:CueP family metal-binding protein [Bacillota bacterium]
MKKSLLFMVGVFLVMMLAACGASDEDAQAIKEKVHQYSVDNFDGNVTASITSHELIVNENGAETSFSLPDEEFFVSIAPFVEETHPCAIHSLTGCQGELVEKEFKVYIEDEDGNKVVDETMTSLANGFIDLWLPRDETFHVTIEHDEKMAEAEISTYEGDNTCITGMQLL